MTNPTTTTQYQSSDANARDRARKHAIPASGKLTPQLAFSAFHAAHPDVYIEFKRLAYTMLPVYLAHEIPCLSGRLIWELMRAGFRPQDSYTLTRYRIAGAPNGKYKYPNAHLPFYVRLLIDCEPAFAGAFRQTSKQEAQL